jgi:hypothetical protein
MSPRLAGAGMAESIRVFRALHAFELEPHPPDCLRNSLAYIIQRCAIFPAVRWAARPPGVTAGRAKDLSDRCLLSYMSARRDVT